MSAALSLCRGSSPHFRYHCPTAKALRLSCGLEANRKHQTADEFGDRMKPHAKCCVVVIAMLSAAPAIADLPAGYWTVDRSQPLLDSMLTVRLEPDLSQLSAAETRSLDELIEAGRILQDLYERQLHRQAAESHEALKALHIATGRTQATHNLLELYYAFKGPIATTLDNERLPFLPVADEDPGKTIYPAGLLRDEIERYLGTAPESKMDLLHERSVVRRSTRENIDRDLERLDAYPEIGALHAGLRRKLEALEANAAAFYAVPYALVYAAELRKVRLHLLTAAELLEDESPDFAAYLRNRGRDLLSGDYESGDASWVSGQFGNLNAAIGSYETYDDNLLGAKAFYGLSLLIRDQARSRELVSAVAGLQAIEDSLPYDHRRTVRAQIPIGVYNVVADFGQSRSANTATILPNDPDYARKYGRTILMRYNILTNADIFANRKQRFDAVIVPEFSDHLTADGSFERTLWHEIGHYLGVSKTARGQELSVALADYSDLLEEMKSDLVSLFAARALRESGYHDDTSLRAHYADGIRRTLQVVRPRATQPYQNMQLMQFNFYMEFGVIEASGDLGRLAINYDRYHDAVAELLREVLQLQYAADYALAKAFVERWNYWEENLHGRLAQRMRDAVRYRTTVVHYAVLDNGA